MKFAPKEIVWRAETEHVSISLKVVRGGTSQTKLTENFLLTQPGIIDASVWMEAGTLQAHVTLEEGARWTEKSIRLTCALEIGLHATPSRVILLFAKQRAA